LSGRQTRIPQVLLLVLLPVLSVSSQEKPIPPGLNVSSLLKDALLFSVDVTVSSPGGSEELWDTQIEKITIPGRAVNVSLQGSDSRLKVIFTIYPEDKKRMLLVAQSETWVGGEYSSTITSLPMTFQDKLYYYPLGRAAGSADEKPVEVRMAIKVVPYLDSLDESARTALLSAFDASAQFVITGEDP
jgi:hypothetical protein